ncbi:MAG: DUF3179 domain-containing (seleno)protein [bacterium]|nr:DUF3179 domain-containing (seleno)protein [bacterium]
MRKVCLVLALILASCTPTTLNEYSLETIQGEEVTLEALRGEYPTIINFWASWCSFCKDELPLFDQIHHDLPINVIAVNIGEAPSVIATYWQEGGYDFPAILDPQKGLYKKFNVFTQPTTIFIDVNGIEVTRKDGPISQKELMQKVDILLNSVKSFDQLVPEDHVEEIQSKEEKNLSNFQTSEPTPLLLSWYPDEVLHTIPLDEIFSGGPPRDGIPSIDKPQFIEMSAATYLGDDAVGVLVEQEAEKRFYPFDILNWHEVVNDTIGSTPIAVTYCPLCASAVVYDRRVADGVSEFGVSGLLHDSNLLMYDRNSLSLWDQIAGEAVVGPNVGKKLTIVESHIVRFGTLPEGTKVLSSTTGYSRDYAKDPYAGYESSTALYFPVTILDARLHPKTLVYGVKLGQSTKAYTVEILKREKYIEDMVDGERILVEYDEIADRVLFTHVQDNMVSEVIHPLYAYWFSWAAKHPNSEVYGTNNKVIEGEN